MKTNEKTPILFTNNSRKMHGRPMHRKKNNRKRCETRLECNETIDALLEYMNRD